MHRRGLFWYNIHQNEMEQQIVIYEPTPDFKLQVKTDGETVWLSIDQMSELFGRDKSVIGKHVRNVFKEGELQRDSVWAKFAYTATDGKTYQVDGYNLDVIISVGYRVKSVQGTRFRMWATRMLRDMLLRRVDDMRRVDKLELRMTTVETEVKQIKSGMTYLVKQLTMPPKVPKRRKIGFHP